MSSALTGKQRQSLGIVGKIFVTFVCLAFIAAGFFIGKEISKDFFKTTNVYSWNKVDCNILHSGIEEDRKDRYENRPYVFSVRYSYIVNGQEHTSEQYGLSEARFSDYRKAALLAEQYLAGSVSVCYVNPADPSEAVLNRGSLWSGFGLLFPLFFVAVGGLILFFIWKPKTKYGQPAEPAKTTLAEKAAAKGKQSLGCLWVIMLIFGLVFLFIMGIRPVSKIIQAQNWRQTPCKVISSNVMHHRGEDSTTYSVDILYSYEVDSKEYRSNRHSFMTGSSSGLKGKTAIVAKYRRGTDTVCYVNPDDPTDAVLVRGFTAEMLWGLIPLAFVLTGTGGLYYSARRKRRQQREYPSASDLFGPADATREPLAGSVDDWKSGAGPVVLKAKSSPLGKVLGITAVALFWNGIVSVFVYNLWKEWKSGDPSWGLAIFLVPFVLIGLGLLVGIAYYFLNLFNPRPRLTVSSRSIPLGETLNLEWQFAGRAHALQKLEIYLEGRESATYRRGTKTHTDEEPFLKLAIAETTSHFEMRYGQAKVTIPSGAMHSFASANNKIIWAIHVRGAVSLWPDVNEEFAIEILPHTTKTTYK